MEQAEDLGGIHQSHITFIHQKIPGRERIATSDCQSQACLGWLTPFPLGVLCTIKPGNQTKADRNTVWGTGIQRVEEVVMKHNPIRTLLASREMTVLLFGTSKAAGTTPSA